MMKVRTAMHDWTRESWTGDEHWVFPSLDKAQQYLLKFRENSTKPHLRPREARRAAIKELEEIERMVQHCIRHIREGDSFEPGTGRLRPKGFGGLELDAVDEGGSG